MRVAREVVLVLRIETNGSYSFCTALQTLVGGPLELSICPIPTLGNGGFVPEELLLHLIWMFAMEWGKFPLVGGLGQRHTQHSERY